MATELKERWERQQAQQAAQEQTQRRKMIFEYTGLLLAEKRTEKQTSRLLELMRELGRTPDVADLDTDSLLQARRLRSEIDKTASRQAARDIAAKRLAGLREQAANIEQDIRRAQGELFALDSAVEVSIRAIGALRTIEADHADLFTQEDES